MLGGDAELAMVLTRLLRAERLDVEVAYVPRRRTRATRNYRLPTGFRAARRAARGAARRVPLIRDETGSAIVGRACWAAVAGGPWRRWVTGRAAQLGSTGADRAARQRAGRPPRAAVGLLPQYRGLAAGPPSFDR